jgi:sec-independent protein translocase protein TatA
MPNFIKNIGTTEIVIIVAIIILLFGSKIAIALGRAVGDTLREIKKAKNEITGVAQDAGKPLKATKKAAAK